jgi:hypothetical protein
MATTNPTLTEAWSKIVDDTSEFLLTLPFNTTFSIEVAAMATDVAPSGIRGHVLRAESLEGITRGLILSGFIYARTLGGTADVVLSS